MREIHLLSAVAGRRNNWLLSPGKFPAQFLHVIDKNRKLFSSTKRDQRQEEEEQQRGLRKLAQRVSDGGSKQRTVLYSRHLSVPGVCFTCGWVWPRKNLFGAIKRTGSHLKTHLTRLPLVCDVKAP